MSRPGDILRGRVQSQQGFKGGIGCCERKPGGNAGQCLDTSPRVAGVTMMVLQLRYLQTLVNIAAEQPSTIVYPVPMDMAPPAGLNDLLFSHLNPE